MHVTMPSQVAIFRRLHRRLYSRYLKRNTTSTPDGFKIVDSCPRKLICSFLYTYFTHDIKLYSVKSQSVSACDHLKATAERYARSWDAMLEAVEHGQPLPADYDDALWNYRKADEEWKKLEEELWNDKVTTCVSMIYDNILKVSLAPLCPSFAFLMGCAWQKESMTTQEEDDLIEVLIRLRKRMFIYKGDPGLRQLDMDYHDG